MTCYPLGVASHLAIACDCIRRGDLDGAQAALARATALVRDERSGHTAAHPRVRRGCPEAFTGPGSAAREPTTRAAAAQEEAR
jgi:hypothetical protein